MKKMVLYFLDNAINIVYNGKVMNIVLKDVIYKGNIIDKLKFMEEFSRIIKVNKIRSKLFGDNIYIVKNSYFNNRDLFFLESLFSDLGFIKVIYIDIKDFFLEANSTYVEVNKGYVVINLDVGVYLDLDYFKDVSTVLSCFAPFMQENVILFGTNDGISKVKCDGMKIYYMDDNINYITQSLLKVNKYDA